MHFVDDEVVELRHGGLLGMSSVYEAEGNAAQCKKEGPRVWRPCECKTLLVDGEREHQESESIRTES
jgi:hypothetical protein